MKNFIEALVRLYHYLYALSTRRFWIPCPRCKVRFGGHEKYGTTAIYRDLKGSPQPYRIVCPKCAPLAITHVPRPKKFKFLRRKPKPKT